MIPLLIALIAGVAAYAVFVILVPKAVPDESSERVQSALDRLYEENRSAVSQQKDVMRSDLLEESAFIRLFFSSPIGRPLFDAAVQAGYQGKLQQLLIRMGIFIVIGLLIVMESGLSPVALVFAFPGGYYMALRHCKGVVHKRNKKFIDMFPDALDTIVRSVRSGFPLSVALQMLAENAEEPVRSEFRQVVEEVALGRTMNQALARLAARIKEPDMQFFVVVLGVQQETGGNLAEIIGNLSTVIRKRKQLRHKIKAMTSEGKATGIVLGGLPFFVFGILYFLSPGYLDPLFYDPLGQKLFGTAIGLLIACFIVFKQMINVDI